MPRSRKGHDEEAPYIERPPETMLVAPDYRYQKTITVAKLLREAAKLRVSIEEPPDDWAERSVQVDRPAVIIVQDPEDGEFVLWSDILKIVGATE